MASSNIQLTLHVTIKVAPHNVQNFLDALRPCWECCIQEPENLFFDVYHSPSEPGVFRFVEVWSKDREWFVEHQITKSYYGPYIALTQPMWLEPREIAFSERLAGWSHVSEAI